jgi:hypothetical protein
LKNKEGILLEGKRRHKRFPCMGLADIRIRGLRTISRVTIATLHNISVSGMMCASGIDVPVGTRLDILIYEFMGRPSTTILSGKVAWTGNGNSHYMGISFDEEITEKTDPTLYKFICEFCDEQDESK